MSTDAPAAERGYLRIEDVVKEFDGYRAVNHVSLDIAKGEIFALLGSSGCGKSTLLRLVAGFETPTSGRIVLAGQDLGGLPPYQRPLNMMFQSYALFPHLTVAKNVEFGLDSFAKYFREIATFPIVPPEIWLRYSVATAFASTSLSPTLSRVRKVDGLLCTRVRSKNSSMLADWPTVTINAEPW